MYRHLGQRQAVWSSRVCVCVCHAERIDKKVDARVDNETTNTFFFLFFLSPQKMSSHFPPKYYYLFFWMLDDVVVVGVVVPVLWLNVESANPHVLNWVLYNFLINVWKDSLVGRKHNTLMWNQLVWWQFS